MRTPPSKIVRFGRFEFDQDRQELRRSGMLVKLAPQPTRLLGLLLSRPGEIVTREEIRDHLWPDGTWVEHDHGINQSVRRIRTVLGDDAASARFVETLPKQGYRFFGGVEDLGSESSDEPEVHSGKSRVPLLVAAVTVLLLIVGFGVNRMTLGRGGDEDGEDRPFDRVRLERLTNRGAVWAMAISRDGQHVAYALNEDAGYVVRLKQLDTGRDTRLVGPIDTPIKELEFSPDGRRIFYQNQDSAGIGYSTLFQVSTAGGPSHRLISDVDSGVASAPDGTRLAFVRGYPAPRGSALIQFESDGGNETILAEWDGFSRVLPITPAWSPDGAHVAVAVRRSDAATRVDVVVVEIESGAKRTIGVEHWDEVAGLAWLNDGSGLMLAADRQGGENRAQLWRLDWPAGAATQVSDDLNAYARLSMADDGAFATIRKERRAPALLVRDPSAGAQIWTGASRVTREIRMLRRGPDGGAIFTAFDSGDVRLWRMSTATTPAEPLLPEPVAALGRFSVSPDGVRIVYEGRDSRGVPHLWTLPARGGAPQQLTDGDGEFAPAACPDGGPVVFRRREQSGLWAVDRPGDPLRRVSDLTPVGLPVCSPEGNRVALRVLAERAGAVGRYESGIVVLSLESGASLHRITPYHGREFAWSPDGQSLTYIGQPDSRHTVWQIPLRTGQPQALMRDTRGLLESFDWTVDGSKLLLSRVSMSSDAVLVSPSR